ncbi:hypothetical protein ACIRVK_23520 [Streptomyces sp. NPDC101152]|uniref:hypothetical protein n=1 Tax=Streptomyces sp. NPDC101152 TaxID=3366116 RepID=UPI00382EE1DF
MTLPDLNAYRIKTAQSHNYALLAYGTWRHIRTDTASDSQGRVSTDDAHGDVSVAAQEKCVTTTYAAPSAGNTVTLSHPDQVTSVSGPCGTAASASTLLADKKIYYDGDGIVTNLGTFGQLDQNSSTAIGQVSAVRTATDYTGSTENWQTNSAMKYDGAGRITDSVEATGQSTHTAFSPPWSLLGGNTNPTSITTTNCQSWKVTSTLDARRGLPTENVDANNRKTDITYHPLGRRTAVWLPGRDKAEEDPDPAAPPTTVEGACWTKIEQGRHLLLDVDLPPRASRPSPRLARASPTRYRSVPSGTAARKPVGTDPEIDASGGR